MRILFFILFAILLVSFVSAADIVLVGSDVVIEDLLDFEGIDYDVALDSELDSLDWESYDLIVLKETDKEELIGDKAIIFLDKDYVYEVWSGASVGTTSHFKLNFLSLGNEFTEGFSNIEFNCYNQANTLYQLSSYSNRFVDIISYKNSNRGVVAYSDNKIFFGITETDYWTSSTKQLFMNSIEYLIGEIDDEAPIIELISPINDELGLNETHLYYDVSDNLAETLNCTLFSDLTGSWKEEVSEIVYQGENDFYAWDIENGNYSWQVRCFDGKNYGESNIEEFSLNINYNQEDEDEEEDIIEECEIDSDCASGEICENGECVEEEQEDDEENRVMYEGLLQCESLSGEIEVEIRYPEENSEYNAGREFSVRTQIKNNLNEDLDFDVFVYVYDSSEKDYEKDDEDEIEIEKNRYGHPSFEFNTEGLDGDYKIYLRVETEFNGTLYCNEDFSSIEVNREEHDIEIEEFTIESGNCGDEVEARVKIKNSGRDEEDVYITFEGGKIEEETDKFDMEMDEEIEEEFYFNLPKKETRFKIIVHYSGQEEVKYFKPEISCQDENILLTDDNSENNKIDSRIIGLIIGGFFLVVIGVAGSIFLRKGFKVGRIKPKTKARKTNK